MSDSDIQGILKGARENNKLLGITGLLVYHKRNKSFMQILEGEKQIIFKLFDKIKKDERHKSIQLVHDEKIEARNFKDWSMAFAELESIDKSKLEGFSEFLEKGFTDELIRGESSLAVHFMKTFRESFSLLDGY